MNTMTDGAAPPAAEPAAIAQPEGEAVNPDTATGQDAATETSADNGDDAAAEQPKRKHWAHERISELTRRYRDAQREAEHWKAKAQTPPPSQDNYSDYDDFMAAKTAYHMSAETASVRADEAARLAAETFEARAELAREKLPDFDAVAFNQAVTITPDMAAVIRESESGPELAYALGKNPTEARRIASLPAHMQAAELGKMEARLSAPVSPRTPPPAPPQAVTGMASGGAIDPNKMTMAEYVAARTAGKI